MSNKQSDHSYNWHQGKEPQQNSSADLLFPFSESDRAHIPHSFIRTKRGRVIAFQFTIPSRRTSYSPPRNSNCLSAGSKRISGRTPVSSPRS